jgi:hypothetical protein
MALSDAAKAELRDAIRIVREDKFEAHARGVLSKFAPKEPETDPLINPEKDPNPDPNPNPAPPKKDDPNPEPPKGRAKGYWGELMVEE